MILIRNLINAGLRKTKTAKAIQKNNLSHGRDLRLTYTPAIIFNYRLVENVLLNYLIQIPTLESFEQLSCMYFRTLQNLTSNVKCSWLKHVKS